MVAVRVFVTSFNTQPPKGGCSRARRASLRPSVSTQSRLKAAGLATAPDMKPVRVSTHSRLKAAAPVLVMGGKSQQFQHTAA